MRGYGLGIMAIVLGLAVFPAGATTASGAAAPAESKGKAPAGKQAGSISSEILGLHLNAARLDKLVKAESNLSAANESDPVLLMTLVAAGDENAKEDWVRHLEGRPKALEAIRTAGLTPREYFVTAGAVTQAYGALLKRKQGKELPSGLAGKVPEENIAFVQAHIKEVEAWGGGKPAATGTPGTRPNTMEDIYTPPSDPQAPAGTTDPAPPREPKK
jgi:hypothetical protein